MIYSANIKVLMKKLLEITIPDGLETDSDTDDVASYIPGVLGRELIMGNIKIDTGS